MDSLTFWVLVGAIYAAVLGGVAWLAMRMLARRRERAAKGKAAGIDVRVKD